MKIWDGGLISLISQKEIYPSQFKRRRAMRVATAGRIFQVREGKSIRRFVCYFYYHMNKKSQERVMAWPLQVDAVCIHDKCYCVFAEGDERRTSCNHAFMKTDPYCCTRWTLVKLVMLMKVMMAMMAMMVMMVIASVSGDAPLHEDWPTRYWFCL